MLFTRAKIKENEETAARKLHLAREEKKLTINESAAKTGIKTEYLLALENGNFGSLPPGIYEKTYLKKYAAFLGIKQSGLWEKYEKEKGLATESKNDVFSRKKIKKTELQVFPKILRIALFAVLIAGLFLYLGFYLKNSFSPPKVEIYQPTDNLITENNFVEIIGKTNPNTQITINDRKILKDESGNFREKIELGKGINTVTITAQNKYSRKKIIQKQILVK
jgi:cytoskeletal protein RodZ